MDVNRCVCCNAVILEGGQFCPKCEKGGNDRPKTNLDRIREMTVEGLAEFLERVTDSCSSSGNRCRHCPLVECRCCDKKTIIEWLESEVDNN